MMPVVRISDELFRRLQRHATPLVDGVSDVLERILDQYENRKAPVAPTTAPSHEPFSGFPQLWTYVAEQFNSLGLELQTSPKGTLTYWKQIKVGKRGIHYEWAVRKKAKSLDVCLHFESDDA